MKQRSLKIQKLIKQYRKEVVLAVAVVLAFLCARFMVGTVSDATLSGALLFAGCSVYIVLDLRDEGKWERAALLCGYVIRVALICYAVFALDSLSAMPIQLGDAGKFYRVSLEYYAGDFSARETNYPYVIYVCHLLFGAGRIIPLYLNVFCWYLCWKVIKTVLHGCNSRCRLLITLCWALLPANIWLTTELIRESIMALFIALSFLFLIRWQNGGRWINLIASVICSFPAIYLHTVSIAMWGGIGFALVFWSREQRHWVLGKRNTILLAAMAALVICFFSFKLYRFLPYSYIPSDLSWRTLSGRINRIFDGHNDGFAVGRSDYLRNVFVESLPQFIFWTVVRCIYFWLSPVVFDWNSWMDPAVALADALPLAVLIVLTFLRPKRKGDGKYLAGVVALVCYTVMYAWATSNAGTALRHRNMLLALLLMTCALRHTSKSGNDIPRKLEKTDAERIV